MPSIATDLPALGVQPFEVSPSKKSYPFDKNRDYVTYMITRFMKQNAANFTKGARGVDTDAMNSGGDPLNYLCEETPAEPDAFGSLVSFQRSYVRIPGPQVTYPGSRYFPLPTIANQWQGLSDIPAYNYPNYLSIGNGVYSSSSGTIYTETGNNLYGPTKTCGARVIGYATAGTFTLTFGANTTAALAYNASNATIAAAINGLASVSGAGLTCSVSTSLTSTAGGVIDITWTAGVTTTSITMNAGGLTLTTSNHPVTFQLSPSFQSVRLPDHITITAHGLNTALTLAALQGQTTAAAILIFAVASWGSIDANTLWLPTVADATALNNFQVVATFKRSYVPGKTYLLRTRVTDTYYLPGITAGIATASDIPTTLGLQDPNDFIFALTNLTGWQTYDTQGPVFWMDGPIFQLSTTEINLDDIN